MLHAQQHQEGSVLVVTLAGEAGVAEAAELSACIIDLAASRPRRLIFDFSRLTFISSLALGELTALASALKRHKSRLAIAGASHNVTSALHRVRLHQEFEIFDSLQAACEAIVQDNLAWAGASAAPAVQAPN